jgi:alpha-galactosidase
MQRELKEGLKMTRELAAYVLAAMLVAGCTSDMLDTSATDAMDARLSAGGNPASEIANTLGGRVPLILPRPSDTPIDTTKPIKVFVLAGQSNMLEMGAIGGRSSGVHQDFYPSAGRAASGKLTFEGAWSTTYGDMRLVVKGDSVKGTYSGGADSTLVGTAEGRRFDFSYTEPTEKGKGWFELSPDGLSFAGKWRKTGETEWKSWTGKRGAQQKKFVKFSVYKGAYSSTADYDNATPVASGVVEIGDHRLKRVKRRRHKIPMKPFPAPALKQTNTTVLRGYFSVGRKGRYEFEVGNGEGAFNTTTVEGREVYRRSVGQSAPTKIQLELEPGKRYAFKTVFFKKPTHYFRIPMTNVPGALETLAAETKKYAFLKDENGKWAKRNDVFFHDVHPLVNRRDSQMGGNFLQVPTKVGGRNIGLELMFGHVVGTAYDEGVLLIRSACGNRGLFSGFLPEASGKWTKNEKGEYTWTGTEYRFLRDGVKRTLANIAEVYPDYAGQGYTLAGFVWFQGHKDKGAAADYEKNLVMLLTELRKDLEAPELPVVIATVGFEGEKMGPEYRQIHSAQMALGDPAKHSEFAGQVTSIDTVPFWREREQSPGGAGYHYNNNAETYCKIGEALGRAMVDLLGRQ